MLVFQVMLDGVPQSEFTSLAEALREAVIVGSIEILPEERPEPSNSRRYSMSPNAAPEDYHWVHQDLGEQDGDGVVSTANIESKKLARRLRREWLRQFPISVSEDPEQGFRVWRWINPNTDPPSVAWSERRPWDAALPTEAGFWPDDGGSLL